MILCVWIAKSCKELRWERSWELRSCQELQGAPLGAELETALGAAHGARSCAELRSCTELCVKLRWLPGVALGAELGAALGAATGAVLAAAQSCAGSCAELCVGLRWLPGGALGAELGAVLGAALGA